jgi:hypothetical protein
MQFDRPRIRSSNGFLLFLQFGFPSGTGGAPGGQKPRFTRSPLRRSALHLYSGKPGIQLDRRTGPTLRRLAWCGAAWSLYRTDIETEPARREGVMI